MTTDADIFKANINKLSASGGGDIPELCLSGLQVSDNAMSTFLLLFYQIILEPLVCFVKQQHIIITKSCDYSS